jgi:hypothetical protein
MNDDSFAVRISAYFKRLRLGEEAPAGRWLAVLLHQPLGLRNTENDVYTGRAGKVTGET